MDRSLRKQLVNERRFDELHERQLELVAADPTDPERRREMAWVLAAMRRLPEAVEAQREACRLSPENARYRETLEGYLRALDGQQATLGSAEPPQSAAAGEDGSELARRFTEIHDSNQWRGSESPSGPGSSLSATIAIRAALPLVVRAIGATSMLDAPCGDFGWMSQVQLSVDSYTGIDVVPGVIELARARAIGGEQFRVGDITRDPLPEVDLVLCRDCLVHLSVSRALEAIVNFKRSASRFLLTTTFYAQAENQPGAMGGWRPVNLQREPFGFGPPVMLIPERAYDPAMAYSDKSLGLWEIDALPDALTT